MTKLRISDTLSVPVDVTTQALAWLGRRGSGKSYGATKLAELLYDANAQFVGFDPVGIWYGLRLAANGKDKGLDIPIFGGLHWSGFIRAPSPKMTWPSGLACHQPAAVILTIWASCGPPA